MSGSRFQLRESVFGFAQKELAPKASEIDRSNKFDEIRTFWRKLGELGTLGTHLVLCHFIFVFSESLFLKSASLS